MASHFISFNDKQMVLMQNLLDNRIDNQFIKLNTYGNYSDIVQYSAKYNNLKAVMVRNDNLDKDLELL